MQYRKSFSRPYKGMPVITLHSIAVNELLVVLVKNLNWYFDKIFWQLAENIKCCSWITIWSKTFCHIISEITFFFGNYKQLKATDSNYLMIDKPFILLCTLCLNICFLVIDNWSPSLFWNILCQKWYYIIWMCVVFNRYNRLLSLIPSIPYVISVSKEFYPNKI